MFRGKWMTFSIEPITDRSKGEPTEAQASQLGTSIADSKT
jgi:hypothetical protein